MRRIHLLLIVSILLNIVFAGMLFRIYFIRHKKQPVVFQNVRDNSHWKDRKSQHELLSVDSNDIVFTGTSLTSYAHWDELFKNENIKNRGIAGDNSEGLLHRIGNISKGKPAVIFIEQGTNDIMIKRDLKEFLSIYSGIIDSIKYYSPGSKIFVQGIPAQFDTSVNRTIQAWNNALKKFCEVRRITFIDLYTPLLSAGKLSAAFSNDGIHFNGRGYEIWKSCVAEYLPR